MAAQVRRVLRVSGQEGGQRRRVLPGKHPWGVQRTRFRQRRGKNALKGEKGVWGQKTRGKNREVQEPSTVRAVGTEGKSFGPPSKYGPQNKTKPAEIKEERK